MVNVVRKSGYWTLRSEGTGRHVRMVALPIHLWLKMVSERIEKGWFMYSCWYIGRENNAFRLELNDECKRVAKEASMEEWDGERATLGVSKWRIRTSFSTSCCGSTCEPIDAKIEPQLLQHLNWLRSKGHQIATKLRSKIPSAKKSSFLPSKSAYIFKMIENAKELS